MIFPLDSHKELSITKSSQTVLMRTTDKPTYCLDGFGKNKFWICKECRAGKSKF